MSQSIKSFQREPITVESALTKSAYIKISLIVLFKTWGTVFFCVFMIASTYLLHALDAPSTALLFIWALMGFYVTIIIVNAFFLALSPKNFAFFLPTQYVFDDKSILMETELVQTTARWESVITSKVAAGYYVLFFSTITFVAIPKSAFSLKDIPQFKTLLQEKVHQR